MAKQQQFVYLLSSTAVSHGMNHVPEHEIVGVFASKAAAAKVAGRVETMYGDFDSAIKDMFEENHIDNRGNPPDDGCLIQIGSEDVGEGDYVTLDIKKMPILGAGSKKAGASTSEPSSAVKRAKRGKRPRPQAYQL